MSEVKTLGNQMKILSGFPFPSADFTSERNGKPIIRIRDLQQQNPETYFTGDYDGSFLISKGDVLVGMDGDFNAVKWQGPQSLLNQRVCKITTRDPTILDQDFLYHSLQPQLNSIHCGTAQTTVKHLSTKDLYSIDAELPPLPEQKKIAEILSGVDEAIVTLEQQRQKHILTYQDLLDDHFSRSLESSSIPLADTLSKSIEYGANASASALERNGLRFLRITDINEDGTLNDSGAVGVILPQDEQQKYQVFKGDVLLARTGNTVGKSYLYRKSDGNLAFAGYLLRVATDSSLCLPEYLFLYTKSSVYKKWISDTCRTGAQPNINAKEYGAMLIPRKPISDQQLFVKIAMAIRDSAFTIERKIQKLSQLKQALTSDLLSGRKRVSI